MHAHPFALRGRLLLVGDVMRQVAECEHHNAPGQIVLSHEAWNLVPDFHSWPVAQFDGCVRLDLSQVGNTSFVVSDVCYSLRLRCVHALESV